MPLLVVAFPEIEEADFNWIQRHRSANDELHFQLVDPHFTFVFPVNDMEEEQFTEEILKMTGSWKMIEFELKCATINKDAFSDYYHEFLVPEKGYSEIVRLHDRLYSGKLFSALRLDIDFIPHIGIGNSKDPLKCKRTVDKLNAANISIKGLVTKLTIVRYENSNVQMLLDIPLSMGFHVNT